MSDTRRLISPNKRRIYPNARTGVGSPQTGFVAEQRKGLGLGQADDITWGALLRLGWTEYDGKAQTDERGYVIPGTDPGVNPTPRLPTKEK